MNAAPWFRRAVAMTAIAANVIFSAYAAEPPAANDLAHEKYTASGKLEVQPIFPLEGYISPTVAINVDAETALGAGIEVMIDGEVVATSHIGKRVVDKVKKLTRYVYYGVPLRPGPNKLMLTPIGLEGERGVSYEETVFGPGVPETINAVVEGPLKANGRTAAKLKIIALDRWQHPAAPGSRVKVLVLNGDAMIGPARVDRKAAKASDASPAPDASPPPGEMQKVDLGASPGGGLGTLYNTSLDPGAVVEMSLQPGLVAGTITLQTSVGQIQKDFSFFAAPDVRKPLVTGLASAGVGQHVDAQRGRIALYGTGAIGTATLATVAYDTNSSLQSTTGTGSFVQDPDQQPYLTYGDSSDVRDDALSRYHLYARIENGYRSLTWGEFNAQIGSSDSVGGYNLLVDGARLELDGKHSKFFVFDAQNNIAYARQVFSPNGLTALNELLHPDIVVGSEIVTLVSIDRHTGAILTQTDLTANVDYSIDYATGFIRFITIPLPFDANFNPQQILVRYEYGGPGVIASTIGGRWQRNFGPNDRSHVAVGYVNDTTGNGNMTEFGQEIGGVLDGGGWSLAHASASGAQVTDDLGSSGGDAYRASYRRTYHQDKIDALYEQTSSGYQDPFGGLANAGLSNFNSTYTHNFKDDAGNVALTVGRQRNDVGTNTSTQANLALSVHRRATRRLNLTAGIAYNTASAGTPAVSYAAIPSPVPLVTPLPDLPQYNGPVTNGATSSTQLQLGADYKLTRALDLSLDETRNIGGGAGTPAQPAETTAQLAAEISKKGRAYIREQWSAEPLQTFATSTAGLPNVAGSTRSMAVGFDQSVGSATTLTSEYLVNGVGSAHNIYSAMGATEALRFSQSLTGNASLQHATAIGENAEGFNAYGLTLNYKNRSNLRISTGVQDSIGANGGLTMQFGLADKIADSFSLLGHVDNARANGIISDDAKVALAWRPSLDDKGVTLFGLERKGGNSAQYGYQTNVVSIDQVFRPSNALELGGRYAYKLDGDSLYRAHTSLAIFRATQRLFGPFDLGAELQQILVGGAAGADQTGFASELGYRIGNDIRLAFGYNFRGMADPSLSAVPTHRGIYLRLTTVIDRIFGWGREVALASQPGASAGASTSASAGASTSASAGASTNAPVGVPQQAASLTQAPAPASSAPTQAVLAQPEIPVPKLQFSVPQLQMPAAQLQTKSVQRRTAAALPQMLAVQPQTPASQSQAPASQLPTLAAQPQTSAAQPQTSAPQPQTPAPSAQPRTPEPQAATPPPATPAPLTAPAVAVAVPTPAPLALPTSGNTPAPADVVSHKHAGAARAAQAKNSPNPLPQARKAPRRAVTPQKTSQPAATPQNPPHPRAQAHTPPPRQTGSVTPPQKKPPAVNRSIPQRSANGEDTDAGPDTERQKGVARNSKGVVTHPRITDPQAIQPL